VMVWASLAVADLPFGVGPFGAAALYGPLNAIASGITFQACRHERASGPHSYFGHPLLESCWLKTPLGPCACARPSLLRLLSVKRTSGLSNRRARPLQACCDLHPRLHSARRRRRE
jgi:hypothetical protein